MAKARIEKPDADQYVAEDSFVCVEATVSLEGSDKPYGDWAKVLAVGKYAQLDYVCSLHLVKVLFQSPSYCFLATC